MWEWLTQNIATVLICVAVLAVIVLAIAVLIRDKKKGKSSCGGNCGGCPMGGMCHSNKK